MRKRPIKTKVQVKAVPSTARKNIAQQALLEAGLLVERQGARFVDDGVFAQLLLLLRKHITKVIAKQRKRYSYDVPSTLRDFPSYESGKLANSLRYMGGPRAVAREGASAVTRTVIVDTPYAAIRDYAGRNGPVPVMLNKWRNAKNGAKFIHIFVRDPAGGPGRWRTIMKQRGHDAMFDWDASASRFNKRPGVSYSHWNKMIRYNMAWVEDMAQPPTPRMLKIRAGRSTSALYGGLGIGHTKASYRVEKKLDELGVEGGLRTFAMDHGLNAKVSKNVEAMRRARFAAFQAQHNVATAAGDNLMRTDVAREQKRVRVQQKLAERYRKRAIRELQMQETRSAYRPWKFAGDPMGIDYGGFLYKARGGYMREALEGAQQELDSRPGAMRSSKHFRSTLAGVTLSQSFMVART